MIKLLKRVRFLVNQENYTVAEAWDKAKKEELLRNVYQFVQDATDHEMIVLELIMRTKEMLPS